MASFAQSAQGLIMSLEGERSSLPEAEREFIECLTFAPSEEILTSLRAINRDDWMAMPVWARNLAYRLACLQRPQDAELLREAAADLLCFGPDWDGMAESMKAMAAKLEEQSGPEQ